MTIPKTYVDKICMLGCGAKCCRYLLFSTNWECAKGTPSQAAVDARQERMTSKGNNCPGWLAVGQDFDRTYKKAVAFDTQTRRKQKEVHIEYADGTDEWMPLHQFEITVFHVGDEPKRTN